MGNYRIDTEMLKKNYQRQHRTISERSEQPSTIPMGNYRIDANGKPIIPSNINLSEDSDLDNNDYFDNVDNVHQTHSAQNASNIYHLNDYQTYTNSSASYYDEPTESIRNYEPMQDYASQRNYRMDTRTNWQKFNQRLQATVSPVGNNKSIQRLPRGIIKLTSIFFLIYLVMLISGWQLLPFNKVNQVVITGNNYVTSAAIENSARIRAADTVKDVISQKRAIEAKIIEENPIIESIIITRDNWMRLELKVTEHQVVAKVEKDGQYIPIMTNGELLDDETTVITMTEDALNTLPTLSGFSRKGKLIELTTILRQVDPEILRNISTISLSNDPQKPSGIIVNMKDGNKVRAVISTFAQKVNFYPEMVQQIGDQIGTINLEVGAYFIPEQSNTNSVNLNIN